MKSIFLLKTSDLLSDSLSVILIFPVIILVIALSIVSLPALAAPQSFYVAEGLYMNGKIARAFEYYQSAYIDLQMEKDDKALQKVLERLILLSRELDKPLLCESYEKMLLKLFPSSMAAETKAGFSGHKKTHKKSFESMPLYESQNIKKTPDSDLKFKIKIYYGEYRPKEITRRLDMDQKSALLDSPDKFIDQFIESEKQKYAETRGYPVKKYGSKNYQMISITHVIYKIYEDSWGKVLYTNEDRND